MKKILALQALPYADAAEAMDSTSSIQCTGGGLEADSTCSIQC
jgi:hypothetical protein